MNALCGYPKKNHIPRAQMGSIVTHEPGGTSVRALAHW